MQPNAVTFEGACSCSAPLCSSVALDMIHVGRALLPEPVHPPKAMPVELQIPAHPKYTPRALQLGHQVPQVLHKHRHRRLTVPPLLMGSGKLHALVVGRGATVFMTMALLKSLRNPRSSGLAHA